MWDTPSTIHQLRILWGNLQWCLLFIFKMLGIVENSHYILFLLSLSEIKFFFIWVISKGYSSYYKRAFPSVGSVIKIKPSVFAKLFFLAYFIKESFLGLFTKRVFPFPPVNHAEPCPGRRKSFDKSIYLSMDGHLGSQGDY